MTTTLELELNHYKKICDEGLENEEIDKLILHYELLFFKERTESIQEQEYWERYR